MEGQSNDRRSPVPNENTSDDIAVNTEMSIVTHPMYEQQLDFSEEFQTDQLFVSRESLVNWVRSIGNLHNIVVLVKRSDKGEGRRARVILGCERGGKYVRRKVKVDEANLANIAKKRRPERLTGTKKCDCPFQLKGVQCNDVGQWSLKVMCGTHNHPMGRNLVGHSYVGRLTAAEDQLVKDLTKNNTRPKDILSTLKESFGENESTLKTIYNARHKHRVAEHGGQSQMQYLLGKLESEKYYYLVRRCEQTDRVKDLFYAHPTSVDLLRAFPNVLLMDCTYKTNRYKMPLLEVVGVTSTDITFSVACIYLEAEREDNYIWALSTIKDLFAQSSLPNVIVTDREIALMNAISVTFPRAAHLLCRWHISKNILANCKNLFRTKEKWDSFNNSWNSLILAEDQPRFNELLRRFHEDFRDYPKAVNYAVKNWIEPYKEKFVSCWTNNVMHFENTASSRAESAHAKLKKQLGTSQSTFEISWERIHSLLTNSHNQIKSSFETSLNVTPHRYSSPLFKIIRGLVSHNALSRIYDELKSLDDTGVDPLLCGCVLRRTCGLPCAHELAQLKRDGQYIQLDMVDKYWRKLDCEPAKTDKVHDEDIRSRWVETMDNINHMFDVANDSQRLLLLKRLREISVPSTSSLLEPVVNTRPRGRPNKKKTHNTNSTKRERSKFEIVEAAHDSCLPLEQTLIVGGPPSAKPMFTSIRRKKVPDKRKSLRNDTLIAYLEKIPPRFHSYVSSVVDVLGDGHCGFRCVAHAVGLGEESWAKVRNDLMQELSSRVDLYGKCYLSKGSPAQLLESLNYFSAPVMDSNYWWRYPDNYLLAASAYNMAFVHIHELESATFLPMVTEVPTNPRLICMAFVNNNHFIVVNLSEDAILPPVVSSWSTLRLPCASGWGEILEHRLQKYRATVPVQVAASPIILN